MYGIVILFFTINFLVSIGFAYFNFSLLLAAARNRALYTNFRFSI